MPQMMPLSWLLLYFFFISLLMLFTLMNYYSHIPNPLKSTTKMINTNPMNWKW
uniref:ATP synthase F0 subunit 8 n=1 Tax=Sigmella ectobioides TaxID=1670702 RepID=UPI0027AB67AC|nr:ATP synthase F0 subunit 8 [Sigmella ectobioides]WGO57707.1 ATP synthase F0 subunit 8 [Sigmella ectobioides]